MQTADDFECQQTYNLDIAFSCCWGLLTPQFVLLPVILALFYMMKTILERQSGMFKKHLIAYFIFFIISGFSSLYYEQQSLFKTFSSIACLQFFTILSYFVFLSGKYSIKDIEKAMVIAYVIFLCCFTIQLISPDEIFNLATDYMDIGRFTMYGQLIAYICLFYFTGNIYFRQDQIPAIHTACVLRPFYSRIQDPDSCHIIGIGPVYLLGKENREYKIYASVPYCHRCSLPNFGRSELHKQHDETAGSW